MNDFALGFSSSVAATVFIAVIVKWVWPALKARIYSGIKIDGKWEMGNGKWEMGNGKWEMGNGKYIVQNDGVTMHGNATFHGRTENKIISEPRILKKIAS